MYGRFIGAEVAANVCNGAVERGVSRSRVRAVEVVYAVCEIGRACNVHNAVDGEDSIRVVAFDGYRFRTRNGNAPADFNRRRAARTPRAYGSGKSPTVGKVYRSISAVFNGKIHRKRIGAEPYSVAT